MHPIRFTLFVGLAFAFVAAAGPAPAQTPRINLDQERAELSARGYTITEGEDAEGNSWWTYQTGSRQPPTRVTFRSCNANGCTTAVFRQERNGACLSARCREAGQAAGGRQFRRLTNADIEGWIPERQPGTLRLEDGEDHQKVVFEHVWAANADQSLAQAALDVDLAAYTVWRRFDELRRQEADGT